MLRSSHSIGAEGVIIQQKYFLPLPLYLEIADSQCGSIEDESSKRVTSARANAKPSKGDQSPGRESGDQRTERKCSNAHKAYKSVS